MLFGGHDSTGSSLSWALYHLAKDPMIYNSIDKELIEHGYASTGDPLPSYEALMTLKYLNAFLKEVWRLHPPVMFSKTVTQDIVLADGTLLPRGLELSFFPFLWGADEARFQNASECVPERWLTTDTFPEGYMPFSAGPRNCIGMKMAYMKMRLIVAMFVRFFRARLLGDEEPLTSMYVTLEPCSVDLCIEVRVD